MSSATLNAPCSKGCISSWLACAYGCTQGLTWHVQALYDPGTTNFASAPAPVLPRFPANITFAECAQRADCTFSIEFSKTLQGMFAYHFFGLLWTNQFITGLECAGVPF